MKHEAAVPPRSRPRVSDERAIETSTRDDGEDAVADEERVMFPHDTFCRWYAPDGLGSGPGSSPGYTEGWRQELAALLAKFPDGSTVLDWGCGDWQHSCLIDWSRHRYVGVEVVPDLVDKLALRFGATNVSFEHYNPDSGESPRAFLSEVCPVADLAICKDVLQHLPNAESVDIIDGLLSTGADLLLVNDSNGPTNVDCEVGGCRHVDPRKPPFSLEGEVFFDFGSGKLAIYVKNK